jgi:tetratricopeptide (TPR) repeat protein
MGPAVTMMLAMLAQVSAGSFASGRPPECGEPGGRSTNVWERAKSPELRRYCDLVASASSKLAGMTAMAQEALDAAREADRIVPGRAAPRVLEGRALVALEKFPEALSALEEGRSRDAGALEDPLALLAWARALARTGHGEKAADAYRSLLPRATALPSADRAAAEIEAGLVSMAIGPARLDEAAAALRGALREAQNEAHAVAVLALALALDRRGDALEGRALLGERARGDPRDAVGSARAMALLAVAPAEGHALMALALESAESAGARSEWQAVVAAAPNGPWAAHARGHLSALGAGKRASASGVGGAAADAPVRGAP